MVDVGLVLSVNLARSIAVPDCDVPVKFAALREKVATLLPELYTARLLED